MKLFLFLFAISVYAIGNYDVCDYRGWVEEGGHIECKDVTFYSARCATEGSEMIIYQNGNEIKRCEGKCSFSNYNSSVNSYKATFSIRSKIEIFGYQESSTIESKEEDNSTFFVVVCIIVSSVFGICFCIGLFAVIIPIIKYKCNGFHPIQPQLIDISKL